MKPVAGSALCAVLLLAAGCAAIKRSTCVRSEKRASYGWACDEYGRHGCKRHRIDRKTLDVCVERVCDPGFNFGPNEPTNSFLVPRGCLTKEEAEKKGRG